MKSRILLLAAAIAIAGPAARANLLLNGSFESPGYDSSLGVFIGTGYYREMYPGQTDIDGWSISGPSPAINWDKITSNQGQVGTYGIFFGPNGNVGGTLSQTFSTTPGLTYDVSLRATSGGGTPVLQVAAAGQFANFDILPVTPTPSVWQLITWQFTANDTETVFSVSKIANGGGYGFELDDISVALNGSEVPETSTWTAAALLALASSGGVVKRLLHRKAQ